MKNEKVWKIAMTGVFAALSYVVFTFLQNGPRKSIRNYRISAAVRPEILTCSLLLIPVIM